MLHTVDLDAGHRRAGQGIDQHAPERIAQRMTESPLQGLDGEAAVRTVFRQFGTFDVGFLDFLDHVDLSSYRVPRVDEKHQIQRDH